MESNLHFHFSGANSVLEMLVCGSYSLLTMFRRNMAVKQKREKAQGHQEKHTQKEPMAEEGCKVFESMASLPKWGKRKKKQKKNLKLTFSKCWRRRLYG